MLQSLGVISKCSTQAALISYCQNKMGKEHQRDYEALTQRSQTQAIWIANGR